MFLLYHKATKLHTHYIKILLGTLQPQYTMWYIYCIHRMVLGLTSSYKSSFFLKSSTLYELSPHNRDTRACSMKAFNSPIAKAIPAKRAFMMKNVTFKLIMNLSKVDILFLRFHVLKLNIQFLHVSLFSGAICELYLLPERLFSFQRRQGSFVYQHTYYAHSNNSSSIISETLVSTALESTALYESEYTSKESNVTVGYIPSHSTL